MKNEHASILQNFRDTLNKFEYFLYSFSKK